MEESPARVPICPICSLSNAPPCPGLNELKLWQARSRIRIVQNFGASSQGRHVHAAGASQRVIVIFRSVLEGQSRKSRDARELPPTNQTPAPGVALAHQPLERQTAPVAAHGSFCFTSNAQRDRLARGSEGVGRSSRPWRISMHLLWYSSAETMRRQCCGEGCPCKRM